MKGHFSYRLTVAGLLTASFCVSTGSLAQNDPPPNIIFFIVDDMGWQDTSVPFWKVKTRFNELYHTPNMERLATEGMKFTQAYAHSVCSPTRTSLMTGMSAARHRVTNWTLRRNFSEDVADDVLEFPKWNVNGLQPIDSIERSIYATTLPQLLRAKGYHTIHAGKAHWGAMSTPGANPLNLGFDVNIAGHAAGGLGSYQGERNFGNTEKGSHTLPMGVPGLEKYHAVPINITEALTIEAMKALDESRKTGKPFYLYMSHYAVHIPLEPDHRFYKKYKDMGLEEPEARYASMVEGMDKSLGDLMKYLDENELANNTIILFMSDNGGLSASNRGGAKHTHNWPLNSGKGSAYEGGIREPMLVRWPGKVRPGSVCDDYLIIEDFFPSILEMAGVANYHTVQHVDGVSFVPLLLGRGASDKDRELYWHFPNKWNATGPGIGATSTIRQNDWKLIYSYRDQHLELYNIREDIGEQNNLAEKHPAKVKELAEKLGRYLRKVNAQRPVVKATGKPAPWPDKE